MSNVTLAVGVSPAFKDALGEYAESHKTSSNDIARKAIAAYIGYDLAAEQANRVETRGRPRKYTPEQRAQMRAAKERENRANKTALLNAFKQQEAKRDMERFRKSVEQQYGPIE